MKHSNISTCIFLLAALSSAACSRQERSEQAVSASSVAQSSASAAPTKAPGPWYLGAWSASFDSVVFRSELDTSKASIKPQAPKPQEEIDADDGSKLVGQTRLTLDISEDRTATGKISGGLGELQVSGALDGDTLRLWVKPTQSPCPSTDICRGTLLAERDGEQLKGTLRTSSGDMLILRSGAVQLSRAPTP